MTEFETRRTILRPFGQSDLDDLHEYCSQAGVGEMAGWEHHSALAQSKEKLQTNVKNPNLLAIEYKENGKVIGHIEVHDDSENGRADTKELGFVLGRDYQRKGIMTEVVAGVLGHLFFAGIETVYCCCFQENEPSRRLIEACGFTFEREGTFYSKSMDKTFSSYEYVYRKSEWERA